MKKLLFVFAIVLCADVFSQEFYVNKDSLWMESLGENLQLRHLKTGRYLTDSLGNVINGPYDYAHIGDLREGRMAVYRKFKSGWGRTVLKNNNSTYLDAKGEPLMRFKYAYCGDFHSGRAVVIRTDAKGDEKYGYIDTTMKRVVSLKYSYGRDYVGDYAVVRVKNGGGVIDLDGKVVLPIKYGALQSLYDGRYFAVKSGKKYGVIDINGNVILEAKFSWNWEYWVDNYVEMREDNGKYFLYDIVARKKILYSDGDISRIDKKLFVVKKDDKKYVVEIDKNITYEVDFDQHAGMSEGMIAVRKDGKWGYLDENFQLVIPHKYITAKEFKNGVAVVYLDGKEYVIDKKGNVVEDEEVIKKATEWKRIIIVS